MRRALLVVNRDEALCLPLAVKVVQTYDRPAERCAYLLIEHPGLPEVADGAVYRKYTPDQLNRALTLGAVLSG